MAGAAPGDLPLRPNSALILTPMLAGWWGGNLGREKWLLLACLAGLGEGTSCPGSRSLARSHSVWGLQMVLVTGTGLCHRHLFRLHGYLGGSVSAHSHCGHLLQALTVS